MNDKSIIYWDNAIEAKERLSDCRCFMDFGDIAECKLVVKEATTRFQLMESEDQISIILMGW